MDPRTQAIINELVHQRNQYADAVAMMAGEIAALRAEIEELKQPKDDPKTTEV